MLNDQRPDQPIADEESPAAAPAPSATDIDVVEYRDIHELTTPPPPSSRGRRRETWDPVTQRSPSLSVRSDAGSAENITTMSREFNAMVVAGATMNVNDNIDQPNLEMIGEYDQELEETNPLAIVADNNPFPSPRHGPAASTSAAGSSAANAAGPEVPLHLVKREEVESKISAWQIAEIAKINNKFKREEVIINGWESQEVEKSTAWLKKIERKLDERKARAAEKMQNEVARARQKAEEKRASAEGKRGTKVAKVFELANFMRAVGRAPSKRSFF